MRIPLATYRLQFNRQFRFEDARALVPYLHALGITDLYASPLLAARRGSTHGYDGTDPGRLNPELGTEQQFDALVQQLQHHRMGLLLDIVPNHMAASSENPGWMDVLENGPGSTYAGFFDIDWNPPDPALKNKVLLPLLGAPYRRVLENRELTLTLEERGLFVRYYEHKLPVAPASYPRLLKHRREGWEKRIGPKHPALLELQQLLPTFESRPRSAAEQESSKQRLWQLYVTRPEIKEYLDENLRLFNGTEGDAQSFRLLDALLREQAYQLAFWRHALKEINYRRFFDIGDLVCLRPEDPRVFGATHALLLRLCAQGKVTGLRVDHVDGLFDPLGYLRRLQGRFAPPSRRPVKASNFYVLVEKILAGDESLPADWPVAGTTGYDFLNAANGIFVDPHGVKALDAVYARFIGARVTFTDVVYEKKKQVTSQLFAAEMHALGRQLKHLAKHDRRTRRLSQEQLAQTLTEVTACLPVYRTYIRDRSVPARDRRTIKGALKEAKRRNGRKPAPAFDFLRRVLLLDRAGRLPPKENRARLAFVRRWQQFTGPIMAKGFEDTALYAYNRLVSLNEVGGEPGKGAVSVEALHRRLASTQKRWPYTLNPTSTHDTKRGEDVRARLNVLSELPRTWERCLRRWSRWNQRKKPRVAGRRVPDRNEEILLYQTLLGAGPLQPDEVAGFPERLQAYTVKAAREAKRNTSWLDPKGDYEAALARFVGAILAASGENKFLPDFLRFQKNIAYYGAFNGLAQVLLKFAAPGVPDFYQGAELWDFRLVDPDNRRPVDFEKRAQLLEDLKSRESRGLLRLARELLDHWPDGRIKLFLIWKALNFRRVQPELFREGAYIPVRATGKRKENICAFARRRKNAWALAVVPRLLARLVPPSRLPLGRKVWGATWLVLPRAAPTRWRNVLTGETLEASFVKRKKGLPLHSLLQNFPVALLVAVPD